MPSRATSVLVENGGKLSKTNKNDLTWKCGNLNTFPHKVDFHTFFHMMRILSQFTAYHLHISREMCRWCAVLHSIFRIVRFFIQFSTLCGFWEVFRKSVWDRSLLQVHRSRHSRLFRVLDTEISWISVMNDEISRVKGLMKFFRVLKVKYFFLFSESLWKSGGLEGLRNTYSLEESLIFYKCCFASMLL